MPKSTLPDKRTVKPIDAQCCEMIDTLTEAQRQIRAFYDVGDGGAVFQLLEGCQNLAVSLGTMIENRMPEAGATVHALEDYCERIYEASEEMVVWRLDELDCQLDTVKELLDDALNSRKKEILFLPVKASWWHTMEPTWKEAAADPANDVYVMPLPYLIEDAFSGEAGEKCNDSALFPSGVAVTNTDEYDISARHPDEIVTQYPYDEWGDVVKIPEFFYSKNLLSCTDKLVYVPCYDAAEPQDKEDKAAQALKVLIEQPAVLYADQVILPSEAIRQLYVETLVRKCGKASLAYWSDKISVASSVGWQEKEPLAEKYVEHTDLSNGTLELPETDMKLLLYQVNAAYLVQYGEEALQKIRETIGTISANGEQLRCVFSPHESVSSIADFDKGYGERLADMFADIRRDEVFIYDANHEVESRLDRIDGYYGNPGRLAHLCAERGIPVMLMAGQT